MKTETVNAKMMDIISNLIKAFDKYPITEQLNQAMNDKFKAEIKQIIKLHELGQPLDFGNYPNKILTALNRAILIDQFLVNNIYTLYKLKSNKTIKVINLKEHHKNDSGYNKTLNCSRWLEHHLDLIRPYLLNEDNVKTILLHNRVLRLCYDFTDHKLTLEVIKDGN